MLLNSEPVAASEDHVLVKFDEEIHCEIVNKDDEKRNNIESVVCNIVNKTVKVVGVPADQWLRVEQSTYKIVTPMKHIKAKTKHTTVSTNRYCSKAKDLFGEETVHLVDED